MLIFQALKLTHVHLIMKVEQQYYVHVKETQENLIVDLAYSWDLLSSSQFIYYSLTQMLMPFKENL